MENSLEHEDLLIKLRAKLNEEKIKLWEPPYTSNDGSISTNLQELGDKYSAVLSLDKEIVINGLYELQQHSIEKSKAIAEFKETGLASFRVKVNQTGQKPRTLNIQKKLDVLGSDLINTIANEIDASGTKVKLIYNGKVLKPNLCLAEQGLKNGVLMMALIMGESQEKLMTEDKQYKEMKATLEDATLLSEHVDNLIDDEYMKIEDQSGKALDLPPAERRSLMVGLALHERGRTAAKQHDYSLALLLFLEADTQLNECSSSILSTVDNWAVLQLDIAWCYLCLRSLPAAADAAARLSRAELALRRTYGDQHERLIALKGTAANERVLLMRLYLLQGIIAYHQNKRAEARNLLEKAENELRFLKVDENAVSALQELGWSRGQARCGLRAAGGDLDAAHHYLAERRAQRDRARERHRQDKRQRALEAASRCADGSALSASLVDALQGMGYARALAAVALRRANNHVADAVRLIQEQPELLIESDEEPETPSTEDLPGTPDNKLVIELEAMGYEAEDARLALRQARNRLPAALDMLVAATDHLDTLPASASGSSADASTSRGTAGRKLRKYLKKQYAKKREREAALKRLSSNIHADDDDHLDTSLVDEEQFLAEYKSLL